MNFLNLQTKKTTDSPSTEQIIREEQLRGDKLANRFRYLLFMLMLPTYSLAVVGQTWILVFNVGMLSAFLLITILHSWVILKGNDSQRNSMSYVVVIFDFLMIFGSGVYYAYTSSPDNLTIYFKIPAIWFFIIIGSIAALQFRKEHILILGALTFLGVGLMSYIGLTGNVRLTNDWVEYGLGDAIIFPAFISSFILVMLSFFLTIWYIIKRVQRMTQKIANLEVQKSSLSRYFPRAIAEEIIKDPEKLNRGQRLRAAVLYCDIRDFTKKSELLSTEELVEHLSEFRKIMVDEIFRNNGTVEKFIGDAIMAVFGAPTPSKDAQQDSLNALIAAKGMLERINQFNLNRQLEGEDRWEIGIGLHIGQVFVGNIGHESTFEYSVIGDAVNTAARIEGLCKPLNAKLLISDEVYNEFEEEPQVLRTGDYEVKGKAKALKIHQLI